MPLFMYTMRRASAALTEGPRLACSALCPDLATNLPLLPTTGWRPKPYRHIPFAAPVGAGVATDAAPVASAATITAPVAPANGTVPA